MKYSNDFNKIVIDPPMTFMTASGLFEPPSTLLFGFKPLTTPISSPTTQTPSVYQGRFKFATWKPKTYFRSSNPGADSNKHYSAGSESQSESFFDKINNFFQPISRIMNG